MRTQVGDARAWVTRRIVFPYGSNSLNLFRLILAFFLLWVHSYAVLGLPDAPAIAGVSLGTWAVHAFFLISGALITRSRLKTTAGALLVHRVAWIMPGFLVCLVVTAFVFAPVALLISRGS
ncbi:acyltransferase family protein [Microbacterium resistens]|uniref:acyltransferase family protein n=1 Tax=Microbacterium resistens TaxID=156977 RepID=UPI00082D76B5|nr:acyltransferase family protein [Microbacterium resistens]